MIRINLVGQLGNQMYQYAFCRSLANKLGYNFYCGKGVNLRFGDNNDKIIYKHFDIPEGIIDGEIETHYIEEKNNINSIKNNTLLHGFYQNEKYFDKNDVIKWFNFDKYGFINPYDDDICFIHYRGTDFIKTSMNLNSDYYEKAIDRMNAGYYIILTDDIVNADKIFKNIKCDYKILKNEDIYDLYLLSTAHNIIASNSTFCDWGIILNSNIKNIISSKNINY